ncbi:MAG: hypothetical protein WCK98_01855 [bacterium]
MFSITSFLILKAIYIPEKLVYSTEFLSSKNQKIYLRVVEIGYPFDQKNYEIEFQEGSAPCKNFLSISNKIGQIFTANYSNKTDISGVFEFKNDKIIVYDSLYDGNLSKQQVEGFKASSPQLIIPEAFYTRVCR